MQSRASLPEAGFEIVVVGAGVLGLAIAAALARKGVSLLVLEREGGIARGITSRNSEVIHAGLYYPAGSLKATSCVEGRERLYRWCAEKRVDHRRLGKLVVASDRREIAVLEELLALGRANHVDGLELIEGRAVAALEPEIVVEGALLSPDTGIVDGHGLCLSLLAEAEAHGAILALGRAVESLEPRSHGWSLGVRDAAGGTESIDAGCVVDAAGLEADRIAELAGLPVDALGWRQVPCKGDYFSLSPSVRRVPGRLVYPVPQQAGLGIHVTLDLAGRVRFGPDAEYLSGSPSDDAAYYVDPAKADRFRAAAARFWPALAQAELAPDYAGLRPKLAGPGEPFRDFVVEETSSKGVPGFVACLGIESPGLTAALALAERVAGSIAG